MFLSEIVWTKMNSMLGGGTTIAVTLEENTLKPS
jgi:hypothetical protein